MDYVQLLKDNGLDEMPGAEDTSLAFNHEIANTLFDPGTPFDEQRSDIRLMPEVLDSMIVCKLCLLPGKTRMDGLQYLMTQWYALLRYAEPEFEAIERQESVFGTEVKIFVLGKDKTHGCTFTFTIVDKAAEDAKADFIGGYSAADKPNSLNV